MRVPTSAIAPNPALVSMSVIRHLATHFFALSMSRGIAPRPSELDEVEAERAVLGSSVACIGDESTNGQGVDLHLYGA